jgi:tRNA(Ile)-lysidine synthase
MTAAPSDPFVARIQAAVAAHRLLPPRARIVVGVSGGRDSVALLHALGALQPAWGWTLHAAHLDHGLRPESRDDAEFVRSLASEWGVPSTVERADLGAGSIEEAARRARYAFLLAAAARTSADHIALGHTADDQAETVLMRMLRGAGLLGLSAIPVRRAEQDRWIVRPMLELRRADVNAYVTRHQLPFREDASNADRRFLRNRVRHELLPLLERDYNPNVRQALVQIAEQSALDHAQLQADVRRQWKRLAKTGPSSIAFALRTFRQQPKALQRQLLRQAIQQLQGDLDGFEFRHWLEAERLFLEERPAGTILDLPGGLQLVREPQRVVCRPSGHGGREGRVPRRGARGRLSSAATR